MYIYIYIYIYMCLCMYVCIYYDHAKLPINYWNHISVIVYSVN